MCAAPKWLSEKHCLCAIKWSITIKWDGSISSHCLLLKVVGGKWTFFGKKYDCTYVRYWDRNTNQMIKFAAYDLNDGRKEWITCVVDNYLDCDGIY